MNVNKSDGGTAAHRRPLKSILKKNRLPSSGSSCNVHDVNDTEEKTMDSYRSLLLLTELASEESLSQRELSRRLGIALGLVNSYLKNLVAKGFVRITSFPRNRFGYLLTPQGIAEKSRLAYQHLSYFTSLYRITRQDYLDLFRRLTTSGVRSVSFCGVDEVAEIAYLSLRETGLELAAVMDDDHAGESFFDTRVTSLDHGLTGEGRRIIITSVKRGDILAAELMRRGIGERDIFRAGAAAVSE
jgi:DNA-binding MarR family transcriptional regulator